MPDAQFAVHKAGMTSEFDLVQLATEITEVASTTTDPETASRLLDLADRLLTEAGFPDAGWGGGDMPPNGLLSEPVCSPA